MFAIILAETNPPTPIPPEVIPPQEQPPEIIPPEGDPPPEQPPKHDPLKSIPYKKFHGLLRVFRPPLVEWLFQQNVT